MARFKRQNIQELMLPNGSVVYGTRKQVDAVYKKYKKSTKK